MYKPLFKLTCLLTFTLGLGACVSNAPENSTVNLQDSYADVLDLKNAPDSASHYGLSSFSDMGAWHSFALPQRENAGTFPGPFLMTQDNGAWLSKEFVRLQLKDIDLGGTMGYQGLSSFQSHYYPGRLRQSFRMDDIEVTMELIFISNRSALWKTTLHNRDTKTRNLSINWSGDLFFGYANEGNTHGFSIDLKENSKVKLTFQDDVRHSSESTVTNSGEQYSLESSQTLSIEPDAEVSQHMTISVYFDEVEEQADQQNIDRALDKPETYFQQNQERWNGYLEKVTDLKYPEYDIAAVKALNTLMNNWRSPAQDLHYNGLFPSYAYRGFHGVWSWDSWKHAVAIARFDPELAKDQMRVMYDYQDEMGMVADVIYRDKSENNWRDTKPPLSVWAIWKIYEASGDKAFLEEMYDKAIKYHRWWYTYRDHDKDGLCEYGSTDGTRIAAAWESGMDNAVRFDDAIMLQNNEQGWSLNQESADLNAYLYAEKNYLIEVARVLGKTADVSALEAEAKQLKEAIRTQFYSASKGYFYDKVISSDELKEVEGTEGWTPLWAGVATQEQADAVFKVMLDTGKFDTYVPLPTFTKDHPKFNPRRGYWRGPVWLDQVYFGLESLKAYGRAEEAERLMHKLFNNAKGLKDKGPAIHENYHPITGEGLNARHFSWSSAHILLMLLNDIE